MQNWEVLAMVSASDQVPGPQRQGEEVFAAAARAGHLRQDTRSPLNFDKGELVVLLVAITTPVSWQVRGATILVTPYPASQPEVQVLPIFDPWRRWWWDSVGEGSGDKLKTHLVATQLAVIRGKDRAAAASSNHDTTQLPACGVAGTRYGSPGTTDIQ